MGLGLFLARAVVERLGGELHLLSVPAKGTQVVLSLPLGPLLTGATIRRMADAGEAGVASPKGLNE
jgi:two-component system sensor histidine kinase RegB